ncbi:hypothetical protein [Microvirga sp. Mcv34]|uniref:hypothetical protein n=1 Tax=Microvirga sp. Mcv34 TaxID=2926016 RepID=UPI0021CA7FC7|nr:hypothetical protein [Microvirga sp. Mcv34]
MSRPKKNSHKLTVEQVLDIRLHYAVGDREWAKIGRLHGVKADAVRNAALGVSYKQLPMPPGWKE